MSENETLLTAPFVVNEGDWKEITLRVFFDAATHEPLLVRVTTDDLTIDEEQNLGRMLRVRPA